MLELAEAFTMQQRIGLLMDRAIGKDPETGWLLAQAAPPIRPAAPRIPIRPGSIPENGSAGPFGVSFSPFLPAVPAARRPAKDSGARVVLSDPSSAYRPAPPDV